MAELNPTAASQQAVPSSSRQSNQILPDIELLCMLGKFSEAFKDAVEVHFPDLQRHTNVTMHNCTLKMLPKETSFDAVVSPANSYGRLDGAFDDALAHAYRGDEDYFWLTRQAQRVLYDKWRGFAPPGTCTVVPLNQDGDRAREHPWGTKYLLLCPTMRVPADVRWDREVVYECIWSLLCAIDQHNRGLRNQSEQETRITRILMTPLATGVGCVSPRKWAEQCVLALKHFVEACENAAVWSSLEWNKIEGDAEEVACTYSGDAA